MRNFIITVMVIEFEVQKQSIKFKYEFLYYSLELQQYDIIKYQKISSMKHSKFKRTNKQQTEMNISYIL